MILEEMKRLCSRKQFIVTALILFFAVVLDFLVTCKCFYGLELSYIRSAYWCTIIKNSIGTITKHFYITLMPILACLLGADCYCEEYSLGITKFLYTRMNKKKNLHCKMAALAICVFSMFFFNLLLSLVLSICAFPIRGHYSTNTTYLTLAILDKNRILSWLEIYHPYYNIIFFMFLRSLIASSIAMLSFSVSLFHSFNRYIILLFGFIYFILYTNVSSLPDSLFWNTNVLGVNTYGNIWAIIVFVAGTIFMSLMFVAIGGEKDDLS